MNRLLTQFILLLTLMTTSIYAQNIDTIYSSLKVKIIGDKSVDDTKIKEVLIKFEPYVSFQDFLVKNVYKGIKAPINYVSNPTAREYKTRLSQTYKREGLNFAGHYCFVFWGCGSPCQSSAIVDLTTGKVYDGPSAAHGYQFKGNSKMVIVNPPDLSGFIAECATCQPEIWVWNETTKKFKQLGNDE